MTFREAATNLFAMGFVLAAADSCAAAPGFGPTRGLRDRAAGYELAVLEDGVPAPAYHHAGETFVLGQLGSRYTLRVSNHSGRRIEAVVSVDGRDAIDGQPADFRSKRGYLVPAWGSVDIEGWRISTSEAAAFRFSSVPDSYAARTGSAREVGVVGVAIFPERYLPPQIYRRPYALPSPSPEAPRAEKSSAPSTRQEPGSGEASASRNAPGAPGAARSRSGLGTEYGEAVTSPIHEVEFVRENGGRPDVLLGLRYNDRQGLLALGIALDDDPMACDRELELRGTAEPFPAAERRFAAPPRGWRRACSWR
jgi:hypothetical protein